MIPQAGSSPHPRPAVGAVVIDSGSLLLVRRGRDPYQGCWAVPGGKVRWGESLTAAVVREVKEETGLFVDVGEVFWVGEAIGGPGPVPTHHHVLIDFAAVVVGGTLHAGSDALDAAFVPLAEVLGLSLTPTMHQLLDTLDLPPTHYPAPLGRRPEPEDSPRRIHVSQGQCSKRS